MEELEKVLQKLIDDANLKVDIAYIEYVKDGSYNYLRVYIENRDSLTSLEDCEEVSRVIGEETEKAIKESFMLEVSTPGIERRLVKEKDFLRFKGKKVELRTKNNIYGKKKFEGKLVEFKNNNVYIDEYEIPFEKVKSTKLIFDFDNIKEMEVKK